MSVCYFLSVCALLPVAAVAIFALWKVANDVVAGDWQAIGDHALFYLIAIATPIMIWAWYCMGREEMVEEEHALLAFANARSAETYLGALPDGYWR